MRYLVTLILMLPAAPAFAFSFGDIGSAIWGAVSGLITEIVIGVVLATLGVLHNKNAKRYEQVARTLQESGEAITQMGTAILTKDKEEAKKVVDEIKDVMDVFKKTPSN